MNILVLTDNFPPLFNAGAERIAYLLSKEYVVKGFLVDVITIDNNLKNGVIKTLTYEGLTVYQIGSNYNNQFQAYISLYNPWVIDAIKIILRKSSYDIAHLHNIHAHISYNVISLLKKYRIKSILTAHDAMSIEYGKFTQGIDSNDLSKIPKVNKRINPFKSFMSHKRGYNPFRNIVIRYYLNKLDKVITVSHEQELLLNVNGIKNTYTINNGITKPNMDFSENDIGLFKDKYSIKDGERILLWAGRLSKAKGSNQVIEVIKRLIKNNYKVKLLVAGNNIFQGHELEKYIVPTGWLDERIMKIAYKVSDITLIPSICYDMFPTVILESMREGTPTIAGCFGGAKEAVEDGKSGYIINPFDTDIFYTKICNILDDEALYTRMSQKSKEIFYDKLTINICAGKYMKLVSSL